MSERLPDYEAVAEEHGGRFGVLNTPESGDDSYGVIVRRIKVSEDEVVICFAMTVVNGGEYRLLIPVHHLQWVMDNPIVVGEEDE